MALIVGGTTVTGTQVLDATKLSGNLPSLNGSSLTNLPAVAPTTGTWTIAPSNGGFASGTNGKYQKIGQVCYFQAHYQWSTAAYVSGQSASILYAVFYYTGLPFTSINIGSDWFVGKFKISGFSIKNDPHQWSGHVLQNSTSLYFTENGNAATSVLANFDATDNDHSVDNYKMSSYDGNGSDVDAHHYISGWYITAS